MKMRKVALFAYLALFSLPVMAEILSCDALRARVDAKLQAKGVPSYTLEIVAIEGETNIDNAASAVHAVKAGKGKEVGTCDGGTKRLIYTRGN
jgi:Protein of unknown function (DUF1161)